MSRQTKIICTIGPATSSPAMLRALAEEGMDIVRLNFSHGTHETHLQSIEAIRQVNRRAKRKIKIMQDLEGYRIRLGELPAPRELQAGEILSMAIPPANGRDVLPLDCGLDESAFRVGMHIYIADGVIDLKVVERARGRIKVRVEQGGTVSSKKNVNIPELKVRDTIFTEKDRRDLTFGLDHRVDYVAQSFVRSRKDVDFVTDLVARHGAPCRVIAKIENQDALRNIDEIIHACDGIIVARGDLGVSVPIYEVPVLQKRILEKTRRASRFDIVATQMLESMTQHPRPTRAEVSDVANAIFDGAQGVMLSGETAVGAFPVEAVRMMRRIIEFTERSMRIRP